MDRGRPPKDERKIPIQIMVRPVVKEYLVLASRVQNKSMSEYVNEILEHFHQGR